MTRSYGSWGQNTVKNRSTIKVRLVRSHLMSCGLNMPQRLRHTTVVYVSGEVTGKHSQSETLYAIEDCYVNCCIM